MPTLPPTFSVDLADEGATLALAGLIARSGEVQTRIEAAYERLDRLAAAGTAGALRVGGRAGGG